MGNGIPKGKSRMRAGCGPAYLYCRSIETVQQTARWGRGPRVALMYFIQLTDGRKLSFGDRERVLVLGYWSDTKLHERTVPVEDVQIGNWIHVIGVPRLNALGPDDRLDLAKVQSIHFAIV